MGHLFICLFSIHLISLLECVFRPLPFFNWVVCFLLIEFLKFFIYFEHSTFIRYVFYKYFLFVYDLLF